MARRPWNRLKGTFVPPAPVFIGIGEVVPPDPQGREVVQWKSHGDGQTGLHSPSHFTRLELLQKEHALLPCRYLKKMLLQRRRILNRDRRTLIIHNRSESRQRYGCDPGERKQRMDHVLERDRLPTMVMNIEIPDQLPLPKLDGTGETHREQTAVYLKIEPVIIG